MQTHAGAKVAETAPGAWLQLRDALDYSDATRFPVAQFGGPVARENTDRLRKILSQYAPMGAVCSDVTTASASRHASRPRQGINSIGWRIWPTNYGKWMTQLDPMGTSVGRWRVGKESNLLGQSSRQTLPGKNMSFVLAPGLFARHREAVAGAPTLHVRIAFFDEGTGGWELHYASASEGAMKLAAHVQKTDTHEFIEVHLSLTDLDLDLLAGGSVHFELADSDAAAGAGSGGGWSSSDPDTFAWIEVVAAPFLYQVAEAVRSI
eukprot:COSAG04_NODE_701_length_11012_cov_18.320718_5_plen_264_part_00